MNKLRTTRKIWTVLSCILLLLAAGIPAGAAETAAAARDIQTVRERISDIIEMLGRSEGLSERETEHLRGELADINVDLNSIAAGLGSGIPPLPEPGGQWQLYRQAELDVLPRNATFNGWKSGNSMVIRIGGDEDIYLTVTNGNYTAETYLPDAYQGAVRTRAVADPGGWVVLEVSDSRGSREFKIENGGLGPVYLRGSGRSTSPVDPGDSTDTVPAGKWDARYRSLVQSGQLDRSVSVEWLREQVSDRDYASDALRDLGEYLRQMEGEAAHERLGVLRWFSGYSEKSMDVPDPRVDARAFVTLMNKIYALDSARDWYRIDLD